MQLPAHVSGIVRVRRHHDGMAGGVEGAVDGGGYQGADLEVLDDGPFQSRHWAETVTLEDLLRSRCRRGLEAGEAGFEP